ncbi:hypothetical protein TNCV_296351 [Trichonephila clavipes]|nr:hypothetical protein TNCV_296351 [Trichonephila clavipes]
MLRHFLQLYNRAYGSRSDARSHIEGDNFQIVEGKEREGVDIGQKAERDKQNSKIIFLLINDEAHFWLNGYVNKQNCSIWSEANPQVYVETPLHPQKLTVWCALWAGGILLQQRHSQWRSV